jgi:hypothetical protein
MNCVIVNAAQNHIVLANCSLAFPTLLILSFFLTSLIFVKSPDGHKFYSFDPNKAETEKYASSAPPPLLTHTPSSGDVLELKLVRF